MELRDGWRSMTDAPRDGTTIILRCHSATHFAGQTVHGEWRDGYWRWGNADGARWGAWADYNFDGWGLPGQVREHVLPPKVRVMELRERAARAIALSLAGVELDKLFASKADWIDARGMRDGHFRDINEPRQDDYRDAADAVLAELAPVLDAAREVVVAMDAFGDDQLLLNRLFHAGVKMRTALRQVEGNDERANLGDRAVDY